jgi:hypothetical protein
MKTPKNQLIQKSTKYFFLLLSTLFIFSLFKFEAGSASSTIIITEVMYDPQGSDGDKEWLELYNVSSETIDLQGWSVETGGTQFEEQVTLPSFSLEPQEYVLIGESEVEEADLAVSSLSMQNGGSATDGVRIVNDAGKVVDTVLYDEPNENGLEADTTEMQQNTAQDVASGSSLARTDLQDSDNCSQDFIETELISPGDANLFKPKAVITMPKDVFVDQQIEFSAEASHSTSDEINEWNWEINNSEGNLVIDSKQELFNYEFTDLGEYSVSLEVINQSGLTDETSLDFHVVNDPENPTLSSIEDIKGKADGEAVAVQAMLTAPIGTILKSEGYIQDNSGGIRVRFRDDPVNVDFHKTYRFAGELDTVYDERRLTIERVLPPKEELNIKPVQIGLDDIDSDLTGSLITIQGQISKIRDRYVYLSPTEANSEPDEENERILYISKYSELDTLETSEHKGIIVRATGILSRYGTDSEGQAKLRLIPRFSKDLITNPDDIALANTGQPISILIPLIFTGLALIFVLGQNIDRDIRF